MPETSTSFAFATEAMRAAVCTAMPRNALWSRSTSPVCTSGSEHPNHDLLDLAALRIESREHRLDLSQQVGQILTIVASTTRSSIW